ncbi:MAG TPA: tetratricopeptide repeat protein, partial [bacterium]|nr:tetratricopeptide repeat protein [bacterium]
PAGLRTAAGFLLLVCLVFGGLAFARNRVWRTELSLWSDNVARAPNKARPRVFLGLAYKHLNQLDRALEQLELAIKLEPRNYYAYCNRGLVYHQLGRHDLALADLSRALEKNPKDPPTLAWRGMVYLDQGALDSALADLDRAAALAPHYAETYFHRGRVRIRKREFEPAIQDFNRMLAHDPGSAITYNQRAIALAGAGQTGAAIADWQEALRRQPDFGEAGFNLALIYYLNRDYQNAWEAVRYLEKIGFPVPGEFLEALRKESE